MPPFWLMPGMPGNVFSDISNSNNNNKNNDKDYSLIENAINNAKIVNDSKHRTVKQYLNDYNKDYHVSTIMSDDDFNAFDTNNTVYYYNNGMKIEAPKNVAFINTVKMIRKPYSNNY